MGNTVTVSIQLDNDSEPHAVRAGTSLRGRVVAQVQKTIPRGFVLLFVKGKEKTSLKRGKHVCYGTRTFFQAKVMLRGVQDLNPGNYSFPFSVDLPNSLPSSFHYGSRPNECSVRYKCIGQVGNATTRAFFSVTSAPMRDERVPCFLEPETREIKAVGMMTKGTIAFGAGVDDTHIGKGQELVLSVACRNDTMVDIERVCVKVVELITWRARESTGQMKNNLVNMVELDLPGLVTGRKSIEEVRADQRGGLDALRRSNYLDIHEELTSGRSSIRIRIPSWANDTYQGTLLTVSHYIKLYLKTPRMVNDIETKIPLRIGFPPTAVVASMAATQGPRIDTPVAPIPFATAVRLPTGTVEAPVVSAPVEAIVLGGMESTFDDSNVSNVDLENLVPLPPPRAPSLQGLLEEMTASVNDHDIISSRLQDSEWRVLFSSLTPADYGAVIAHVNMDFDQPRVAELLASHVNGGTFMCSYCVSALRNTAQWNRTAMVQKLLPLCVDVTSGFETIQEELSPWELTVTERDFQNVLDHSDR